MIFSGLFLNTVILLKKIFSSFKLSWHSKRWIEERFLEIKIETNGQNLINISQEIEKFVENSGIKCGILNLSILHTSASLIIQENVSKDVLIDLENFFNKIFLQLIHPDHCGKILFGRLQRDQSIGLTLLGSFSDLL